jgi:acyl carrier protein
MSNFNQLAEIVAHHYAINVNKVHEDTRISELPGDEFDVIELVLEIEKAFHVKISDADVGTIVTVGDFLKFI